ncbi:AraC family transcriptional regulator [Streptomyces malaysiensis]|uniref:AraC family transcriptional regulator n=1 Tax=Streptomyces malaysiensis TaxID=92644 RepID=UPI0033F9C115
MIEIRSAEEWAAAITTEIVPLGVRRIASGFHASVDRRDLGDDVRITRASAAASAIRRTARDITSSDDGFAIFQLNIAGAGRVSQGDRDCRLDGLSATVYTTDRPAGFEFSNGNDGYLVQMPRELLPVSDSELRRFVVRPLTGEPLLRVCVALLESAREEVSRLDWNGQAVVTGTLLDLLASLLRSGAEGSAPSHSALLGRMQHHIDRHCSDPGLDVSALAGHFSVSTRLVHSTFASIGATPAERIRSARLRRARQLIEQTDLLLSTIAAECGFGDFSTFVRAFKRAHHVTPSAWRRQHLALRSA